MSVEVSDIELVTASKCQKQLMSIQSFTLNSLSFCVKCRVSCETAVKLAIYIGVEHYTLRFV